jgi:hypothetical protein
MSLAKGGSLVVRTYRSGAMLFPSALLLSFFIATGPRFWRWSALGLVMMLSQMTAELLALSGPVQSAVTYTKSCLVFHVKSEERSASREKRMMAYSSFLEE